MNSLNSVLLEGNLTRDPVLGETPKGTPVCTFGLAVNRFYRQEEETVKEVSFFEVETWTRLAQYCSSQLAKGKQVRVVGHLKQERWEDQEGKPHSRVKVIGEHLEIQEKKPAAVREGEEGAGAALQETPAEEAVLQEELVI